MPHMKYFQGIADIKNHYEDIIRNFESISELEVENYASRLLDSWGINLDEKELILEEIEVLSYLLACQLNIATKINAVKPSIELVNRCFKRHLKFLEEIHNCHQWNVNKHRSKLIIREYNTCTHYLFKFTQKGWVDKLPNEILTFENKYPDFDENY